MKKRAPVRSNFSAQLPLTYAAIGATRMDDLVQHPPTGFRSREYSVRLGSGSERFLSVSQAVLSWDLQRNAGVAVENVERPATSETDYNGLIYDPSGIPLKPDQRDSEQVYREDGTPAVSVGVSADLLFSFYGLRFRAPVRVVYLISDARRVGFAYGTSSYRHPVSGEEGFVVEHRPDDSVWLVIRLFFRPSKKYFWPIMPLFRWQKRHLVKRYLRAFSLNRSG